MTNIFHDYMPALMYTRKSKLTGFFISPNLLPRIGKEVFK